MKVSGSKGKAVGCVFDRPGQGKPGLPVGVRSAVLEPPRNEKSGRQLVGPDKHLVQRKLVLHW